MTLSIRKRDGSKSMGDRVNALDWQQIHTDLDDYGNAVLPAVLSSPECDALAALYSDETRFRSRVVMQRHNFGRGQYKYFCYPLPENIGELRTSFYAQLQPLANRWSEAMGSDLRYPPQHADYIRHCHKAGQMRATPLLLEYGPGDFNCLHQDLYGDQVFPFQVTLLLSDPGKDFTGGEFVLTEQRPRMQSRAEVVPLGKGDGVAFAVNNRPVQGKRGYYRVNFRHGVSRLRSGRRFTVGIIFHDAK